MIKFKKTESFLCNTKNTDRNGVNKQITQTTERKITSVLGAIKFSYKVVCNITAKAEA